MAADYYEGNISTITAKYGSADVSPSVILNRKIFMPM